MSNISKNSAAEKTEREEIISSSEDSEFESEVLPADQSSSESESKHPIKFQLGQQARSLCHRADSSLENSSDDDQIVANSRSALSYSIPGLKMGKELTFLNKKDDGDSIKQQSGHSRNDSIGKPDLVRGIPKMLIERKQSDPIIESAPEESPKEKVPLRFQEEFEETSMWIAVGVYICYAVIMGLAYLREFIRRLGYDRRPGTNEDDRMRVRQEFIVVSL